MKDPERVTARTVFQVAMGVLAVMPLIVAEAGLSPTVKWVSVLLAVSAAVTRIMQIEQVDALFTKIGLGKGPRGKHAAGARGDGHG